MVPLSFDTPTTQIGKKKKYQIFFPPNTRKSKHLESLPVEKHRCLGMRMISKAHGNSGGSRRLEAQQVGRYSIDLL